MLHIEKCEKCGIEIKLQCHCMCNYKFYTAANTGISIGLLRTKIFYVQSNKNYPLKIHGKSTNTMQ